MESYLGCNGVVEIKFPPLEKLVCFKWNSKCFEKSV